MTTLHAVVEMGKRRRQYNFYILRNEKAKQISNYESFCFVPLYSLGTYREHKGHMIEELWHMSSMHMLRETPTGRPKWTHIMSPFSLLNTCLAIRKRR